MSIPCSKPLQHKSSPEDGQNLAEVWPVSSFSSPWFLTSLSESQLQFNQDLLQARAKFNQYQEESNSLRGGLTSPGHCSLSQWSDSGPAKSQESRAGFLFPYHDPTWQSSQRDGKRTQILPRVQPQKGWIWVEICDQHFLLRHFPGCFPWVLRCWLTCTGILGG